MRGKPSSSKPRALICTFLLSLIWINLADAQVKTLKSENTSGRKGKYFLPENWKKKKTPLMLLLHGSSIDGNAILKIFKKSAKQERFIIVAPDSVNSIGWQLSNDPSQPTEDQRHIQNCLNEVMSIPGLRTDTSKVLAVGVSAGGAIATYLGSNNSFFKKMASVHGGVPLSLLGSNDIPVWLSTGTNDLLRTPQEVSYYASELSKRFTSVSYKEYEVGHQVATKEKKDLVRWWLKGKANQK